MATVKVTDENFETEVVKAQKAALPPEPPKKWWQKLNPFKK